MSDYIKCFACGAKTLNISGACHKYMLASPGCWEMFNEIMVREFSDLRYWKAHQYTVDAYACQHPGKKDDQRAINSIYIHLAALYGIFVEDLTLDQAPMLRSKFAQYFKINGPLPELEPPASMGDITVYDLWDNDDINLHYDIAEQWARSVWDAWSHHHERIAELVHRSRN